MNTVTILVSRTFSEVTPESAEDGDTSDTGFVYEAQPVTFTELVFEILSDGFRDEGGSDWLTARSTDYRTGTEREECLHFDRENPPHLRKWFDLAVRFARSTRRA